MTQQHSSLAFRWALRLHPAAYRAEHEAELTAIYAEATQDAGPLGRLREALDVAGHGLRRRTGLGSDRMAGQVLAQAAPLAIAVATGSFVAGLLWLFAPGVRTLPASSLPNVLSLANTGLMPLLWLAALAGVWTGRWTVARALVVPAMVLCLADVLLAAFSSSGFHGTPSIAVIRLAVPLLTGAVVLAAPRDLLGPPCHNAARSWEPPFWRPSWCRASSSSTCTTPLRWASSASSARCGPGSCGPGSSRSPCSSARVTG
ncbi:hypothetical protein GCM10011428_71170 [Streptomyces violaceus]